MAITTSQAQGLVLALFGASAGGHLTGLAAASNLNTLAGDLTMSAGLILGRDLSSNTAFRDHITSNLKLTGDALTAANAWLDGQLNAGAARGDMVATAVTFLSTLTDTTSPFFAAAQAFNTTVTAAVTWSTGAGATEFGVAALREQQGHTEEVVGSSFTLTTSTDNVFGTAGNDTFTATSSTLSTADVVADSTSTDSDVMNVTLTDDIDLTDATIVGIEAVNFNLDAFTTTTGTTLAVDLGGVSATNVAFDVVKAGSRVAAIDLDEVRTGTVTLSSEILTATVTGNNNANIVINANTAATATFSLTEDGATTNNLTVNGTGAVTLTNVDADGTVTVNAADDITVTDADPATALVATSTGGKITVTTADGAETLTLTAKEDVDVAGATGAETVTIHAMGTLADTTARVSTITATAATTLNVSGNSAGLEVNAVGSTALDTINFSGDQSVEVQVSAASVDALTSDDIFATDSSTAGTSKLTLNTAAGNVDARGASEVDVIELAVDNATKTLTVASGETVQISVSQGAGTSTITGTLATAANNTVNLVISDDATATNTITLTADAVSNFKTVNISLLDNLATATSFNAGSTSNVVVTGSKTLTLAGTTTASSVDASAMTGVVTANLAGGTSLRTISTGSAADAITVAAAMTSGGYTINTGAGADVINMIDATATIDGGDGDDTVAFTATADLSGQTFALSNVEVIDLDKDTASVNTLTVDSSQLTGKAINITSSNGTDSLTLTLTESSADFSSLVIDASAVTTTITADAWTAVVAGTVTGTNDADTITGNGGKSFTANGGSGNDTITGGAVADTLNGDAGNDTLNGAAGADALDGGAGADTLNGDGGADVLTGGAGDDTFVITAGESTEASMDSITDYQAAAAASDNDTLDIYTTDDADAFAVGADIAATDNVDLSSADAAGTATDIEAVVNDGILTLVGDDIAQIDTLAEWIDAATLALASYDEAGGAGGETVAYKEYAIGFEYDGSTYVVTAIDTTDDTAADIAVSDVVKLVGLTDISALVTTAAANSILVA